MPHFDWTISLGSVIQALAMLVLALFAWKDMDWRVRNLENWRKEHMVDADARDALIKTMGRVLDHVRWQTNRMLGGKEEAPPRDIL